MLKFFIQVAGLVPLSFFMIEGIKQHVGNNLLAVIPLSLLVVYLSGIKTD